MKDFAQKAVNCLQLKGASYGDVRIVDTLAETIATRNGTAEELRVHESLGFGVRAIVNGAWGFASSSRVEPDEIEAVVSRAVAIAEASSSVPGNPVVLSELEPVQASYATPVEKDPFAVSLDDKLDMLYRADEGIRQVKGVSLAQAFMTCYRVDQVFASSEGALIEQRIVHSGAGMAATAVEGGEMQVRSYPNSFRGNFASAGYEYIEALRLVDHAERVGEDVVALMQAPQCPDATTTLILDGGQLALQVHESIGHPIELDRVFGTEASYAGTSFLTLDKLDGLQYGSEIVNVVGDATTPGGLGTYGYDDEGVPAQCVDIIRDGKFVGYLSSRETAPRIGRKSTGAMRADGWQRIPLIRMPNVNLLPGEGTLDELIASTDDGIFMMTNRSWSIDDKRLNFQFGTEIAYQIGNGKLGQMYKNPTYTGITPEFWNSCDAICGPEEWKLWGTPNCGKGQPSQCAHVGHGVAPACFRNVRVGVLQ